jgi:hypothetical protein
MGEKLSNLVTLNSIQNCVNALKSATLFESDDSNEIGFQAESFSTGVAFHWTTDRRRSVKSGATG